MMCDFCKEEKIMNCFFVDDIVVGGFCKIEKEPLIFTKRHTNTPSKKEWESIFQAFIEIECGIDKSYIIESKHTKQTPHWHCYLRKIVEGGIKK